MLKHIILLFIAFASFKSIGQNKSGYTWIVGNNGSFAKFDGTSLTPQVGSLYSVSSPSFPYVFAGGHSNICDSASGKLLFVCNGMVLYDTVGNIIENGDSLVPEQIYLKNSYPSSSFTQSSIILPKGNQNLYYVIIPTVSDSAYNQYWTNPNGIKYPFDEILCNVVDMNANGGLGKVILKNKILLNHIELSPNIMQACRHSNGVDWWLLKQGLDSNIIYRFLVTKDSIYGPYVQNFQSPNFVFFEGSGQSAFSKDGTKYAVVKGKSNKLFLADFDRCTGELTNPNVFNLPIDSTNYPYMDSLGIRDSISSGVSFSPNGKYIYISKWWNIYQFEFDQIDSNVAWYNVIRGTDTTWPAFEFYKSLMIGPDNKLYIGKRSGGYKRFSVINSPDNKGINCNFCRKCFGVDSALGGLNTPPNMPDYNLAASGQLCWPLGTNQLTANSTELKIYPNPTSNFIHIEYSEPDRKLLIKLYDSVGKLILATTKTTIDVSKFSNGVYFVRTGDIVKKVLKE